MPGCVSCLPMELCWPTPRRLSRLRAWAATTPRCWTSPATAQELTQRDYLTDLFPKPFTLDGGTVTPDLVASKDNQVYYVECERHTRKKQNERQRKWDLYQKMTGGHFYLVVPNKTAQSALVSELSKWVYQTQRAINLHLSSQTEWNIAEDFWTLEREIRRGGY